MEFRPLMRCDEAKVIDYAIKGMHFDWYMDSKVLQRLYGRYFWYLETGRATQMIAAYDGERLAGVLLAEMKGEQPLHRSVCRRAYVWFAERIIHAFFGGVDAYDGANRDMYAAFTEANAPDGEIIFLAADPEIKGKGTGTMLLNELERREKGRLVYLYTDDACTWQFYEKRGFNRVQQRRILLDLGKKKVNLLCLLYAKRL